MGNSILTDTKKYLGIAESYEAFDADILMQINSALTTAQQLGVGPIEGVFIEDKSVEWAAVLPQASPILGLLKSYIFMKARLGFDPPDTSHHMVALKEQIEQAEWRLEHGRTPPEAPVEEPIVFVQP